jgi:hypothetical protein
MSSQTLDRLSMSSHGLLLTSAGCCSIPCAVLAVAVVAFAPRCCKVSTLLLLVCFAHESLTIKN